MDEWTDRWTDRLMDRQTDATHCILPALVSYPVDREEFWQGKQMLSLKSISSFLVLYKKHILIHMFYMDSDLKELCFVPHVFCSPDYRKGRNIEEGKPNGNEIKSCKSICGWMSVVNHVNTLLPIMHISEAFSINQRKGMLS